MKVCHVINSLSAGGAESLLMNIIQHTDDADVEYVVYYLGGDETLLDELTQTGAQVHSLNAAFHYDPAAMFRLYRALHKSDFDVLHTHLPNSQWIGRVVGYLSGTTHIVSTHHSVPQNYGRLSSYLERITRPIDSVTVGVSERVCSAFDSTNQAKWRTIHNGIDVDYFAEAIGQVNIDKIKSKWGVSDKFIFLTVGRYVPVKNQRVLIEAMPRVLEQVPNAHLFVVGWGQLESKLRETALRLGVEDEVTITGRSSKIEEFYAIADIYTHSAVLEGFGIVLLEAMAAETPIIATDLPAIREIIDDTGILVPTENPGRMAKEMCELAQGVERESLAKRGKQRVQQNFTIQKTVDQYVELYRKLMRK